MTHCYSRPPKPDAKAAFPATETKAIQPIGPPKAPITNTHNIPVQPERPSPIIDFVQLNRTRLFSLSPFAWVKIL